MIQDLFIQNFQSHEESVLEFSPGMNVIVGPSDSGKTSIIRALKWITYNKPGGDEFRSHWGGDTSVTIKVGDSEITRVKKSNYNAYLLNELEFVAFGHDVPFEVAKVLNMESVNLQQQMDRPYLLSETSGNTAAHFNRIANLDKIDSSLQNIQKEIKKLGQDISYTENTIATKGEELKQFSDLEEFETKLEFVENLEKTTQELRKKYADMFILVNSLEGIESKLEELKVPKEFENAILEALTVYTEIDLKKETFLKLKSISVGIHEASSKRESLSEIAGAVPVVEKALEIYRTIAETTQKREVILSVTTIIRNKKQELKTAVNELEEKEKEFQEALPEVCPICNSQLK